MAEPSSRAPAGRAGTAAFTLIELSIVLVIIGLIVGGVLVGQDLIRAAGVRAQISQIEKYNTAVNTFLGKYDALPGDISDPNASKFGLQARGLYPGEGDGNGIIKGAFGNWLGAVGGYYQTAGETVMFWVDLSAAGLIEGGFTAASPNTIPGCSASLNINSYLPTAKVGNSNYVYVFSPGAYGDSTTGPNYFGVMSFQALCGAYGLPVASPSLTVMQAFNIDKKTDDGLPQSVRVLASYISDVGTQNNGSNGISNFAYPVSAASTAATVGSASTCFDNGNNAGGQQQYSLTQSNGAGVNCALMFEFQ